MFLNRLTLGFAAVAALTSGVELVLDDAAIHQNVAWNKAEGNCAKSGYGGSFHHNNGTVFHHNHFAAWNFRVEKNGCYWVEAFHPTTTECDFSLHNHVPVTINFCLGLSTTGLVDQSQRGGQWNKLIKLPFYTNHSASIVITSEYLCNRLQKLTKGIWAADAFRLTWAAEDCHDKSVQPDNAVEPSSAAEEKHPTVEPVPPAKEAVNEQTPSDVVTDLKAEEEEEELQMPLLQALLDDSVDAEIRDATLEPSAQCPATAGRTFHHDALQKGRRAEATFHFDPPRDGCYLIEEMHPRLEQCKGSATTKVHVKYGTGIEETGTVDQSANGGHWTFLAARPFYAGYRGKVTLSNEATAPDTLTVFDKVRFTWLGKSCKDPTAHPRKVEIRLTVDFDHVDHWRSEFGATLKTKLAGWADVPEESLRLTNLRSGSIIAELLVLPNHANSFSALQTVERLDDAVANKVSELCALTGGPVEGCTAALKDHGVALATISKVQSQTQTQRQQDADVENEESMQEWKIAVLVVALLLSMLIMIKCYSKRSRTAANEATGTVNSEAEVSLEEGKVEGKVADEKKVEDESDNNSTNCPSSDTKSESSVTCNVEMEKKEGEAECNSTNIQSSDVEIEVQDASDQATSL
eukprot:gnl/MRDRNA2_/MRDRNA2_93163_c0_seq1.p1 gnl/MRDRNA2_/MRDRNA2_93163_c0~~gnl/MRDRNA2_/MRDRNA2_93163_c0_seq1.p1  ORF type:complete len:635 (-),score=142.65 gnl/MRDRNA2_/MRDRNA2_93163_c0_seq1:196-2100(-)